ncbi:capsule biosynthesis protein [Aquitalea aquatica]|uniref:Capsular biosynthesis protein n=1 Tax=Aquitalea aquatica TaxID=3044273 RepID=A0A838Y9D8_9NEIS|nr:capsular biosynthesis protein [Aquitalea magnusonii]MBA4707394.1 capsular biosynthesis protein [Aquitalea magnusonii]
MGFFFYQFGHWLQQRKHMVYRVLFNGGDWLFYRSRQAEHFRGKAEEFAIWLPLYLAEWDIEAIVCFGDCRQYHQVAAAIAQQCNMAFFVFEEGYLRPDYITLEQDGVNARSSLAGYFASLPPPALGEHLPAKPVNASYPRMAMSAMAYYCACWLLHWRYPHYVHHKSLQPLPEAWRWIRSGLRKMLYTLTEYRLRRDMLGLRQNRFFLVALQVFNDSQVRHHSSYGDVREFITEVITSFAHHAAHDQHLLLKHHPMDRGHRQYRQQIRQIALQLGVDQRVHYLHDAHLPSLLKASRGVITINSTVGLSALHHGKPVITLGSALYDMPGLTAQCQLAEFWRCIPVPDPQRYQQLRLSLLHHTQLNGAFYGNNHWMMHQAGSASASARHRIRFILTMLMVLACQLLWPT